MKARARVEIASEVPMLLRVKRARNLASRECSPLVLSTEALRAGIAAVIWASVRRGVLGSSMASTEMVILQGLSVNNENISCCSNKKEHL